MSGHDVSFLHRFERPSHIRESAIRIGIKDLIDIKGTITTAGSRAVEVAASPATEDAECILAMRALEAVGDAFIVGKTNLHELAYGGDGINPHFGTPTNPLDAARIPGGSSSGSGVAVAADTVDVALGSDTGGSIRIPAACNGIVGLKTTWGRISTVGVWPLAPSLDTIGPMGRTCDAVVTAMDLLESGFRQRAYDTQAAQVIGRVVSAGGFDAQPGLQEAVDEALNLAGFEIVDIDASWWEASVVHGLTVLIGEAARTLTPRLQHMDLLEERIAKRLHMGAEVSDEALASALAFRAVGVKSLMASLQRVQLIATPTLPIFAPLLGEPAFGAPYTMYARPANMLGTPALAIPVPVPKRAVDASLRHLPGSLQLMGGPNSEELLMATGRVIEAAVANAW
jgi:amidase